VEHDIGAHVVEHGADKVEAALGYGAAAYDNVVATLGHFCRLQRADRQHGAARDRFSITPLF
jgi:hypothetical protein